MDDWLRSIAESVAGPIRTLANKIGARLSSIWGLLVSFFTSLRSRWQTLRGRVTSWVKVQLAHAAAVATTLKWIVTVWVPRQISIEASRIRTWTGNLIQTAIDDARKLFNFVITWATGELNKLLGKLIAVGNWAAAQFNGLIDLTGRLARQVFGVLATPERLAAWAVDAIFHALLKYALANMGKVAIAIKAHRHELWLESIQLMEDFLARIL